MKAVIAWVSYKLYGMTGKNNSILTYSCLTLASLVIMGFQLRVPLKTLNTIVLWWFDGFQGVLNWASMMLRDTSLSDSFVSNKTYCPFSLSCFTFLRLFLTIFSSAFWQYSLLWIWTIWSFIKINSGCVMFYCY